LQPAFQTIRIPEQQDRLATCEESTRHYATQSGMQLVAAATDKRIALCASGTSSGTADIGWTAADAERCGAVIRRLRTLLAYLQKLKFVKEKCYGENYDHPGP
jgi:hypothetical protein